MREARVIPLTPIHSHPEGVTSAVKPLPTASAPGTGALRDQLSRPLRDLRISVTDRCNFRCGYCMPRTVYGPGHRFLPQPALLSFEEIERASRIFVSMGVSKLRLTGGEPLLRKQLDRLVARLAELQTPQGEPVELTLTTNATLLATQAAALRSAGLHRVTISLDALDDTIFQRMNDAGVSVGRVLEGIEAAQKVGLGPLKVNMVVQRGVNDQQIVPMARHFRHTGIELRFIEYMDVGSTNGWQRTQVLPSSEVQALIESHFPLTPLAPRQAGETARRHAYADGAGQIGFISSVTQAFCGDCSRLRLSTDGRLYTCLFARQGHDLRAALRSSATDEALQGQLRALWQQRDDRYSQMRGLAEASPRQASPNALPIEMSYIGG
ncbi:MAG TPA: GTP 3',8-cyclase MoaA [Aquabacterium sp.]|uniref:GTP 3',8-cyclase MoaA n=1 Tax=Aquabacterium sp. TaxID=1872578 RepID=UPI002D8CD2A8|nr:GTP 3',8-cyclase MoaA [Aquabacterium sp.]HET6788867.1 GTP 3',8-cyclase MoaA [Aquabacterium sp.]HEX5372231.1 GTP 3',8-cyclase MoaA [Aquabacterium sp.]